MKHRVVAVAAACAACVCGWVSPASAQPSSNPLVALWSEQKPAFGVFVPNEAPRPPRPAGAPNAPAPGSTPSGGPRVKPVYTEAGGEKLAANALYDFVFLNLEGAYDSDAVTAIAAGLRKGAAAGRRPALIVRVPAFHEDPAAGRARLAEVFAAGADGITFPHVETVDEARQILDAARAAKIDVWSPDHRGGDKILMMMLEDPAAVANAAQFADLKGYSVLACGIGSLRAALKGDAAGAEAGTQKVLAETKRTGLANMLTATTGDVADRVKEGFLGILAQGQNADEAIIRGRAVAGR